MRKGFCLFIVFRFWGSFLRNHLYGNFFLIKCDKSNLLAKSVESLLKKDRIETCFVPAFSQQKLISDRKRKAKSNYHFHNLLFFKLPLFKYFRLIDEQTWIHWHKKVWNEREKNEIEFLILFYRVYIRVFDVFTAIAVQYILKRVTLWLQRRIAV